MKTCFKCGAEKPISEFYAHPAMGDGHLGKCKTCSKEYIAAHTEKKKANPDWVISEAARCRDKQRRKRAEGTTIEIRGQARAEVHRRHAEKYPEKNAARLALNNALRAGRVKKHPCAACGSPDSEAHHEDYSKPLDVTWLCPRHHAERHVQINDERRRQRALDRQPVTA